MRYKKPMVGHRPLLSPYSAVLKPLAATLRGHKPTIFSFASSSLVVRNHVFLAFAVYFQVLEMLRNYRRHCRLLALEGQAFNYIQLSTVEVLIYNLWGHLLLWCILACGHPSYTREILSSNGPRLTELSSRKQLLAELNAFLVSRVGTSR